MRVRVSRILRVALGEYDTGWHDPATSLERAEAIVARAAASQVDLVVLPEMCNTGFTMDAAGYAEPLDGASVRELERISTKHGVTLLAGIPTRHGTRFFNSAVVIAPGRGLSGEYRKQRLFRYATEHSTYTPGNGPFVASLHGVRVAIFICFDLRFPELFQAVARDVDAIVVIANWPSARQSHWDTLLRARAIESQAYLIGVNRIGSADGLLYAGGSAAYGPWGELMASGSESIVVIDADVVEDARTVFPFVDAHGV